MPLVEVLVMVAETQLLALVLAQIQMMGFEYKWEEVERFLEL